MCINYSETSASEKQRLWDSGSYFFIIAEVTESWDKIKGIENYEQLVGTLMIQRLFELDPSIFKLFGFSAKYKIYSEGISKDPKLQSFVATWVRMLDLTVHMLGPDLEVLDETLMDLGARHIEYGAKQDYYALMRKALLFALDGILGGEFNKKLRDSWDVTFKHVSEMMIQGAYKKLSLPRR